MTTAAFKFGTSQADAHIKAERKLVDASYERQKTTISWASFKSISSSGARFAFKSGTSQADAHIKARRSKNCEFRGSSKGRRRENVRG